MEEIHMKDVFEQATKMMEQFLEQWRKLVTGGGDWPRTTAAVSREAMSQWIATMRSACESNADAWNTLTQQGEEIFFRTFKESPLFDERVETTMRQAWSTMVRAQKAQQDVAIASMAKIEELIKSL
jgi:hypothetical protein